ncbi:DUF1214 domain-containing protein [Aeromicrobium choanae]|uniref:Carboxylesterase n=1 Tax=Aeromicrobium choanae TaxID=1736691 RepID=A0A1T4Z0J2_9ACTN|nr:DUF1214 domain-containing protein [Aeromicrobium choanae]SKB07534.1 Protein of unknown function [Aeromicrobium choanae]
MALQVNVDNFVGAETARMFHDLQAQAGAVNEFSHLREPSPIESQLVIRQNRDTLYSFAVVDVEQDVVLTLPDCGERYVSAMVVNEGHFVPIVLHDAGAHRLTQDEVGSRYAVLAVRILVDSQDPEDVTEVDRLQDTLSIEAGSAVPFASDDFDKASLDATRDALLKLAAGLTSFDRTFGRPDEVDPVRHLIGTAAGWGGLPSTEAAYVGVQPDGDGPYELTMADVPVDGFWSISVYNAKGFFAENDRDSYSINNIVGVPNEDGSVTVRFGDLGADVPNVIPTPEGWNFLVRLYRPRSEIHDGTWKVPALVPIS